MENFCIEQLTLENYRGIEKETFEINPKFTVIIGKNGIGKTTVLEAAAVMLGAYLAAYKVYVPSRYVFNISANSDPYLKQQKNMDYNIPTAHGIPQFPCTVGCKLKWDKETIDFKRTLEKEAGRTKFAGRNPMQKTVSDWEDRIAKADDSDKELILPIVLYLSSARLWNENSKVSPQDMPKRTDAYAKCLDKKHGTEMVFDYLNKLRLAAIEEERETFPAFNLIMSAIMKGMEDELKEGEKLIFSTRYKAIALKRADKTVIPFSSLSDGYRNVIKIFMDIASRMCILNPYLQERTLEETPGVVLIDELDLSLHPTWQKRIVRILKKTFPKVQFICATHSPFIIQSLEDGELCSLGMEIEDEYSGEGLEDISEDIMGVEQPQYSEKKRKMYLAAKEFFEQAEQIQDKDKMEELKLKLDLLVAEYSDNPAYLAFMKQKYAEKYLELEK